MSTRPGWYPDPSGRFPKRWHDGYDWTASVLDNNGQQAFDQLPPAGAPAVASLPAAARRRRPRRLRPHLRRQVGGRRSSRSRRRRSG